MKHKKKLRGVFVFILTAVMIFLAACGNSNTNSSAANTSDTAKSPANSAPAKKEVQTVRLALSAFQDVNSIYVGIEKGFYDEEGIKLDIQKTDWPSANELLIGGHADLATSCDADIALQNANGQDTTMAFPVFYFAGGGLTYNTKKFSNWKTFDTFMKETNNDRKKAMALTISQLKGKKIGTNGTSDYSTFIEMVKFAGLDTKDFKSIDMTQEEMPPALLSGSIDIMLSGIPQRLAVLKQDGYGTLVDQTALASTITHCGFAAHRAWVDKNPELASKLEKVILKTLDYIEKNPDDAFPIISKHLQEAGTKVDTEQLKGVWNKMEFFPNSKDFYQNEVVNPKGKYYWKDRFVSVVTNLKSEGKIKDASAIDVEKLNYALKVIEGIK